MPGPSSEDDPINRDMNGIDIGFNDTPTSPRKRSRTDTPRMTGMSQSLERVEKDGWEIEGPMGELSKGMPLKLKSRKLFPFRVPARQEYVQLRVLVTKRFFFFQHARWSHAVSSRLAIRRDTDIFHFWLVRIDLHNVRISFKDFPCSHCKVNQGCRSAIYSDQKNTVVGRI